MDDESGPYSKKNIKLKEIQKALASKEKQSNIINLCIFSFVVFFLIIGSSITNIMMNNYLNNKIIIYYNLIEKYVTLYRNLIFEVFQCKLWLLSNLSTTINTLSEENKNKIISRRAIRDYWSFNNKRWRLFYKIIQIINI